MGIGFAVEVVTEVVTAVFSGAVVVIVAVMPAAHASLDTEPPAVPRALVESTNRARAMGSAYHTLHAVLVNTGLGLVQLLEVPAQRAPTASFQFQPMSTGAPRALPCNAIQTRSTKLATAAAPQTPSSVSIATTQSAQRTSTVLVPVTAAATFSSATPATIWTAPPKATTCTEQAPVAAQPTATRATSMNRAPTSTPSTSQVMTRTGRAHLAQPANTSRR